MKAILTTSHELLFKSLPKKVLGFRKKYPSATYLNERPTNTANIGKVHLKCDCVVGSIVNGGQKELFLALVLNGVLRRLKSQHYFCLR